MSETEVNTEKLVNDLKAVARDTEELLRATADTAGEKAAELRERLSAVLSSARTTCERLEQKASASAENTDKAIRDHPYESIGIAFGIGLLIGVVLGRR